MNWIPVPPRAANQSDPSPKATRYEVVLPESRISLLYSFPTAEPDFISLNLQNTSGATVDSWSVDDPEYDADRDNIDQLDPEGDWRLMSALFSEVHRKITGWDKVLNDVEKALASTNPVGVPHATR